MLLRNKICRILNIHSDIFIEESLSNILWEKASEMTVYKNFIRPGTDPGKKVSQNLHMGRDVYSWLDLVNTRTWN